MDCYLLGRFLNLFLFTYFSLQCLSPLLSSIQYPFFPISFSSIALITHWFSNLGVVIGWNVYSEICFDTLFQFYVRESKPDNIFPLRYIFIIFKPIYLSWWWLIEKKCKKQNSGSFFNLWWKISLSLMDLSKLLDKKRWLTIYK